MSSEKKKKKITGFSSTRNEISRPVAQPEEYYLIGILHEHRDNNDRYNFPPVPIRRGAGFVDPQEGAKTKHLASAFNVSVEQNNVQIEELSPYGPTFHGYHPNSAMHAAAGVSTQIQTSQKKSLDRLQRVYKPDVIRRNIHGANDPSWRPRFDDERET